MRTRPVLGLVVAAALLSLSACGGSDPAPSKAAASDDPTSQAPAKDESAAPGLEDVPDVVAEVNGEEISKDEFVVLYEAQFAQATQQSQMTGQEPDEEALKKQTVDNLVANELLTQDAEERGIEVSEEDVDAEFLALAKQYGMATTEEFVTALDEQGTTEDEARDQIETQLMVEQLVKDEDGSIEPTGKELGKLYDQAKKQQQAAEQGGKKQKFPPFSEIKDQLADQAEKEKISEVAQALLKKLRKAADITINI